MGVLRATAVVTGGGRGLGRAFAIGLATSGMSVAVVARTADELAETVRQVEAGGGNARGFSADVSSAAEVSAMVKAVERELGPIELLVNAAGVGGPIGPVWELDPQEWWTCLNVNLQGTFLCCHAVLAGMVSRGRGRIINLASSAGTIPIPYMSAYGVSKAGVIRLTETLAAEAQPHGISIFSIQPGSVRTAMTEQIIASDAARRWIPWSERIFQAGQDTPPERSVELVVFLASGAADSLTGRFLSIGQDMQEMVRGHEAIRRLDLHTLRMRRSEEGSGFTRRFRAVVQRMIALAGRS